MFLSPLAYCTVLYNTYFKNFSIIFLRRSTMMDTSAKRIVITENEDLDLDQLLLSNDSCRDAEAVPAAAPAPPARTPPLPLLAEAAAAEGGEEEGHRILPAAARPGEHVAASHTRAPAKSILKKPVAAPAKEEEDGAGRWVLPAAARPGEYLQTSLLHKAPSKSILKTSSSYANVRSVGSSSGGGTMKRTASTLTFGGLDLSASQGSLASTARRPSSPRSFLPKSFLNMGGSFSSQSTRSQAVGWDLDDSRSSLGASSAPRSTRADPPGAADADRAAGTDASAASASAVPESKEDADSRVRRSVSFCSVDVREYDLIVGDNPSCRSGPPVRHHRLPHCCLWLWLNHLNVSSSCLPLPPLSPLPSVSSPWTGATPSGTPRPWRTTSWRGRPSGPRAAGRCT